MSKFNPKYEINLLDVLDRAYTSDKIKDGVRATMRDKDFKKLYGQRVVDRIVERTQQENVNKKGGSLGSYSKSYKESLIFQIYKSGETQVNLTLTGEMLESLVHEPSQFKIVVTLEEDQRDKAHGHITGKLGKARAKPRDFLGLPKGEETALFKETLEDYRQETVELEAELELSNG